MGAVGGQDAEALAEREFVLLAVLFRNVAPVAADVSCEKRLWELACSPESCERSGCRDDAAEWKEGLALDTLLLWFTQGEPPFGCCLSVELRLEGAALLE